MNPLIKKILLAVGIIAIAFVLYKAFFGGAPEQTLTSETPSNLPAEQGGDLLAMLLQLRSIDLNAHISVFQDAAFQSLQDFTVTLAPEPIGRKNPFAPIGAAAATNPSTTTPKNL